MLETIQVTCPREGISFTALATIGANIARLRVEAGYKRQGDFADAIGVPQSRVSDWENDRYGLPDTGTLIKIAKVLECSIDHILAGVDPAYDRAATTRDLTRHAGDQESDLSTEGAQANVPAEARVELHRLRTLVARYEKEAREVRTVTDSLVTVALALEEIRKTPAGTAHRRGRDRKAG